MKKLNRVAVLFASAALAAPIAAFAQARTVDNWRAGDGTTVWRNGTNDLCWRDAFWTPATAAANCDGALRPPAPAPAPRVAPP
ncbi:MAG: OmpA family protein, partial [Pseudomonadota bacterium]